MRYLNSASFLVDFGSSLIIRPVSSELFPIISPSSSVLKVSGGFATLLAMCSVGKVTVTHESIMKRKYHSRNTVHSHVKRKRPLLTPCFVKIKIINKNKLSRGTSLIITTTQKHLYNTIVILNHIITLQYGSLTPCKLNLRTWTQSSYPTLMNINSSVLPLTFHVVIYYSYI